MTQVYDYAIIGGGVIGSAIARKLALETRSNIAVFEKESAVGEHASGRNSGVVHSGFNALPLPKDSSLKSRLCVEGNRLLTNYAWEKGIPFRNCGTFVVARTKAEERSLYMLLGQGLVAGVPGLRIIDGKELNEHEPGVVGNLALYSPTGSIIDGKKLTQQLALDAQSIGAEYFFNHTVQGIGARSLQTTKGEYQIKHLINCAGLYADKIAHMMNVGQEYTIVPFRGEYVELKGAKVNSMVYAAPLNPQYPFLGVHLTTTLEGKVLAGPNAVLAMGREAYNGKVNLKETAQMITTPQFLRLVSSSSFLKLAYENARTSLSKAAFLEETNALLKEPLAMDSLAPYRAGIRAQVVDRQGNMVDNILIRSTHTSTHVLNAVSPGMTCSLAFADYLVNQILIDRQ